MTKPSSQEVAQAAGERLSNTQRRVLNRRKAALLALLAYAVLSVIMTWPLAIRLGTHLPGVDPDTWVHAWTFWWIKQAIIEGVNPFYTDLLYFPQGVSLATHNIAWFHIGLWLPLQAIFGGVATYNLIMIATYALNAFSMYLLGVEWTRSRPAAFVGGLIFGFWPYVVSRSSSPNMTAVFWLPLALLFLKRTLDRGRVLDALLTGLFVAMIGITRWQLLIMAVPILGLFLLYQVIVDRSHLTRRKVALLGLAAVLALVIMAPLAIPVIQGQLNLEDPEEIFAELTINRASDLASYVVPESNLSVLGKIVPRLPDRLQFTSGRVAFIGYTALVLSVVGAVTNWRSARFWLFLTLFLMLMALGTQLVVADQVFPWVPMPYRLVDQLFIVQVIRNARRFNVLLGLPIAMLATIGTASLIGRHASRRRVAVVIGVISGLILAEYALLPYKTMRLRVPEWYQSLASEPGRFGILDLPIGPTGADKWYMMYQMTHGKPLVSGHVSRRPQAAYDFLDSTPFLSRLRTENVMDPELVDVSRQLHTLADAGIPYLIIHKRAPLKEGHIASWRQWLGVEPTYEDAELAVFRTDLRSGRDFEIRRLLTGDIGIINAGFTPKEAPQASAVTIKTHWSTNTNLDQDYDACIQLIDKGGNVARTDCRLLASYWPTSHWEANELVRGVRSLTIDPFFEPRTYSVMLSLVEKESRQSIGEQVDLGELTVTPLPRVFETPSPSQAVEARWAQQLTLPGYDLVESVDELRLTLYWQALKRMDESYKVFVHLIDEATGEVVAQDDAIPRGWTYPTNMWEKGEVIEDTITLATAGLPTGRYRLQVGVYDPGSGERLQALSADGARYSDDSVQLATIFR